MTKKPVIFLQVKLQKNTQQPAIKMKEKKESIIIEDYTELIDTHSHIYEQESFAGEEAEIVARLTHAKVSHVVLPNIDQKSLPEVLAFEAIAPQRFHPLIGLHPENVNENYKEEVEKLMSELDHHHYYGIGEVGIDLYWDQTFKEEQIIVFEQQIEAAISKNLPIIIHTRNALNETLSSLAKFDKKKIYGIFHSFTGTKAEAEEIKKYGDFKFGINGIVTFKKSTDLQAAIAEMSAEEIVLETDSPYLTPVPFRGKRNESAYLPYIAQKIAEIKGMKMREIAEKTTQNAKELFYI